MNENHFHISAAEAVKLLEKEHARFAEVMKTGTMKVEYFAPQHLDRQMPHSQDELYIVISGTSGFVRDVKLFNASREMCYLYRRKWRTVSLISQKILLPGSSFMERRFHNKHLFCN